MVLVGHQAHGSAAGILAKSSHSWIGDVFSGVYSDNFACFVGSAYLHNVGIIVSGMCRFYFGRERELSDFTKIMASGSVALFIVRNVTWARGK